MVPTSLTAVAVPFLLLALTGCGASAPDEPDAPDVPRAGSSSEPSATASPSRSAPPQREDDASPSQPASSKAAAAKPVVITITDFVYAGPASVAPGAKVVVKNTDRSSHTMTSSDGAFEEVVLEGGGSSGSFTAPDAPGRYSYVCQYHPEMVGTLVVR